MTWQCEGATHACLDVTAALAGQLATALWAAGRRKLARCLTAHPADQIAVGTARLGLSPRTIPLQGPAFEQAGRGLFGGTLETARLLDVSSCTAALADRPCWPRPGCGIAKVSAAIRTHLPEQGSAQGISRLQALLHLALDHVKPGGRGRGGGTQPAGMHPTCMGRGSLLVQPPRCAPT